MHSQVLCLRKLNLWKALRWRFFSFFILTPWGIFSRQRLCGSPWGQLDWSPSRPGTSPGTRTHTGGCTSWGGALLTSPRSSPAPCTQTRRPGCCWAVTWWWRSASRTRRGQRRDQSQSPSPTCPWGSGGSGWPGPRSRGSPEEKGVFSNESLLRIPYLNFILEIVQLDSFVAIINTFWSHHAVWEDHMASDLQN